MRRRKLDFAVHLLLLLLSCGACAADWEDEPFLKPINEHENVTWGICTIEPNCAFVYVKENTESIVELLRLNTDEKPEIVLSANTIGIEISKDDKTPPFFLQSNKPGDYEAEVNQFLASVSLTSQLTFFTATVFLENVNDNPPIIQSHGDCSFEEEEIGLTECTFEVTDVDGSACFLEMKVSDDHFEMELESKQTANCKEAVYRLKVAKALDYEIYRLHSVTISAVDRGQVDFDTYLTPEMIFETTIAYVVHVLDIPDVAPIWQQLMPSISVIELQSQTEQFTAIDGDFGLNWAIKYTLTNEGQPGDEDFFTIDEDTGLLEIASIDRDKMQREIFNIRITATEIPEEPWLNITPNKTFADIVILVKDLNNNMPTFNIPEFKKEHDEETPFSEFVFTVKDPDLAENGTFELSISKKSPWSENFIIVPGTGYQSADLTLAALDASLLDYENEEWRTITLEIVAVEKTPEMYSGKATVVITLINLNDEVPVFTKTQYNVKIEENRPKGFEIIVVEAIDPDDGDEVRYSLRDSTVLIVDETSGLITTKNDMTFDYEKQTEVTYLVYAMDKVNHTVSAEVIVEIIDVNDEPPVLNIPFERDPVDEHSPKGTRASAFIIATDPDTNASLAFTINWEQSVAYKEGVTAGREAYVETVELAKTEQTGPQTWQTYLIVKDEIKFDWELFDTLRVNIEVEDDNTHENYTENRKQDAYLNILVGDINDQAPEFRPEYSTSVIYTLEEDTTQRMLGAVVARDQDGYPHNEVRYSVKPISPKDLSSDQLRIDEKTGQIFSTTVAFDCEEFGVLMYEYIVSATDGLYTTNYSLFVNLTDINDERPLFPKEGGEEVPNPSEEEKIIHLDFEEHDPGEHNLTCLDGFDRDVTSPFNLITYVITEDKQKDYFKMENNCFIVKDGDKLDREETEIIEVGLLMRDNFEDEIKYNSNEGDSATIHITLHDINDHAPQFEELPEQKKPENAKKDEVIFRVGVTDEDAGENGTVECEPKPDVTIIRPDDRDAEDIKNLFRVSTTKNADNSRYKYTCTVYAEKDLESYWGDYELLLKAHDLANPQLTNTMTYSLTIQSINFKRPEIKNPVDDGEPIRLKRIGQNMNANKLQDYLERDIEDFVAIDGDDPDNDNGQMSWTHDEIYEDGSDGEKLFDLRDMTNGVVRLQKLRDPPEDVRYLFMTITVTDHGNPPFDSSIKKRINFIGENSVPEFPVSNAEAEFEENDGGLKHREQLPKAKNEEDELVSEEQRKPIYYSIIDGDGDYDQFFELDCLENVLFLKEELDYEKVTQYKLTVAASHDDTSCVKPDTTVGHLSQLSVTVHVVDMNDEPPRFSQNPYTGTFRVDDNIGKVVTQVTAIDPDTNDIVTYEYIKGSITADASLENYAKDNSFLVDPQTGEIKLNFALNGKDLSGALRFDVLAFDSAGKVEGHQDETKVNIYVVSEKHQVEFQFYNTVDEVSEQRDELEQVLSDILGYDCSIEKVYSNSESVTEILTHFIDLEEEAPVEGSVIAGKFLQSDTYGKLNMALTDLKLTLRSISKPSEPEEDSKTLTIVLAVFCAVLGVLAVVFFLAFVVRSRTLNQRLDKLTNKKFGSQDSGLNREGLAVPGTNRHAIEGSNPVWNHDVDPNFDAASQSSGDSELIGIEDSPEFGGSGGKRGGQQGFGNPGFDMGPAETSFEASPPPSFEPSVRRGSLNPLAAAAAMSDDDPYGFSQPVPGGDLDVPRRFSLNPLAGGIGDFEVDFGEGDDDDEDDGGLSNFPYQPNDTVNEPTTEL